MKKIIVMLPLILLGCNKKKSTAPSSKATTTTVFCWYQVFNGMNAFYKCTSTQAEYNETSGYCATNGMNMVVKEKATCNECQ